VTPRQTRWQRFCREGRSAGLDSALRSATAADGRLALPPDIADLAEARGVNPRQADKLVRRLSGNLFVKLNRRQGR
jgi:hypothetical protein